MQFLSIFADVGLIFDGGVIFYKPINSKHITLLHNKSLTLGLFYMKQFRRSSLPDCISWWQCQVMLYICSSRKLSLGSARLLLNGSCRLPYSTTTGLFGKWKSSRLDHLLANMPKEEPHLKELKEKRMAKRSARALSQPANITWQVCGNFGC